MFEQITIRSEEETPLEEFLQTAGFFVQPVTEGVLRAGRSGELPVFLSTTETSLYFEVDLGNISEFADAELYFKILDLNTEIVPVSLGINSTNSNDPRLVLAESREIRGLDENELLSVFDALELAAQRIEVLLSPYVGHA